MKKNTAHTRRAISAADAAALWRYAEIFELAIAAVAAVRPGPARSRSTFCRRR